jgi:hypothetical protein
MTETSEWKEIKLGDLLSEADLKILLDLINKEKNFSFNPSQTDNENDKRADKLGEAIKEFLISKRQELESKGVLPEYLYYFLQYKFSDMAGSIK